MPGARSGVTAALLFVCFTTTTGYRRINQAEHTHNNPTQTREVVNPHASGHGTASHAPTVTIGHGSPNHESRDYAHEQSGPTDVHNAPPGRNIIKPSSHSSSGVTYSTRHDRPTPNIGSGSDSTVVHHPSILAGQSNTRIDTSSTSTDKDITALNYKPGDTIGQTGRGGHEISVIGVQPGRIHNTAETTQHHTTAHSPRGVVKPATDGGHSRETVGHNPGINIHITDTFPGGHGSVQGSNRDSNIPDNSRFYTSEDDISTSSLDAASSVITQHSINTPVYETGNSVNPSTINNPTRGFGGHLDSHVNVISTPQSGHTGRRPVITTSDSSSGISGVHIGSETHRPGIAGTRFHPVPSIVNRRPGLTNPNNVYSSINANTRPESTSTVYGENKPEASSGSSVPGAVLVGSSNFPGPGSTYETGRRHSVQGNVPIHGADNPILTVNRGNIGSHVRTHETGSVRPVFPAVSDSRVVLQDRVRGNGNIHTVAPGSIPQRPRESPSEVGLTFPDTHGTNIHVSVATNRGVRRPHEIANTGHTRHQTPTRTNHGNPLQGTRRQVGISSDTGIQVSSGGGLHGTGVSHGVNIGSRVQGTRVVDDGVHYGSSVDTHQQRGSDNRNIPGSRVSSYTPGTDSGSAVHGTRPQHATNDHGFSSTGSHATSSGSPGIQTSSHRGVVSPGDQTINHYGPGSPGVQTGSNPILGSPGTQTSSHHDHGSPGGERSNHHRPRSPGIQINSNRVNGYPVVGHTNNHRGHGSPGGETSNHPGFVLPGSQSSSPGRGHGYNDRRGETSDDDYNFSKGGSRRRYSGK